MVRSDNNSFHKNSSKYWIRKLYWDVKHSKREIMMNTTDNKFPVTYDLKWALFNLFLRNIIIFKVSGLQSKLKVRLSSIWMPESHWYFYSQEVQDSVPLTVHLPNFKKDVMEAFLRSLDGGMTVVSQKDFSHLHQHHLGIKEAKGSCFLRHYGAESTEVESYDSQEEAEAVDSNHNILPGSESKDDEGILGRTKKDLFWYQFH